MTTGTGAVTVLGSRGFLAARLPGQRKHKHSRIISVRMVKPFRLSSHKKTGSYLYCFQYNAAGNRKQGKSRHILYYRHEA